MSSELIANIDSAYIISEVALLRNSDPNKACVLVEGGDDDIVYKRFINLNLCQIIICYGSGNLILSIKSLNSQESITGYLGIKDADFDVINGTPPLENLFLTDDHDLETMICNSDALDRFIETRLRQEDRKKVDVIKKEVREKIFELSCLLGYIKLITDKNHWSLRRNLYQLLCHIDHNMEISFETCIIEISNIIGDIDISTCTQEHFDSMKSKYMYHLCNGHELITVLKELFPKVAKKHLAKKIYQNVTPDEGLFLAYEFSMFKKTDLYKSIKEWELNHKPFTILNY